MISLYKVNFVSPLFPQLHWEFSLCRAHHCDICNISFFFSLNYKTERDIKLKLDLGLFSFMTLEHCFVDEIIKKKRSRCLYFSSEVHLCEQKLQWGFEVLIYFFFTKYGWNDVSSSFHSFFFRGNFLLLSSLVYLERYRFEG